VRLVAQCCVPAVATTPNGDDASAGAVALERSAPASCGSAPKPAALTVPEEAADEAELGALSSAGGVDGVKPRPPGAAAASPVGVSMTGGNTGLGSTDGAELALAPAVAPNAKEDIDGAEPALAAPNLKPGEERPVLAIADRPAPSASGALDAEEPELAAPKLNGAVIAAELVLVAPTPNGDDASAGAVALERSAPANCGGAPKPAALTVPEEAADEAELGALSSAGGVDGVQPRPPGAAAASPVGVSMTGGNTGLGAGGSFGADEEEERAGAVKEVGWFESDGLCQRPRVHWCEGIVFRREGGEGGEARRGRAVRVGVRARF
jgi:hypothetical protein